MPKQTPTIFSTSFLATRSLSFRTWEQISRAALDLGPALVWLPCDVIAAHADQMADLIQAYPQIKFGTVLPRVHWDRERDKLCKELAAAKEAGVTEALLSHIGQLTLAREYGFTPRGDFGLGLVNDLAAEELARLGFTSATASFESKLGPVFHSCKYKFLAIDSPCY